MRHMTACVACLKLHIYIYIYTNRYVYIEHKSGTLVPFLLDLCPGLIVALVILCAVATEKPILFRMGLAVDFPQAHLHATHTTKPARTFYLPSHNARACSSSSSTTDVGVSVGTSTSGMAPATFGPAGAAVWAARTGCAPSIEELPPALARLASTLRSSKLCAKTWNSFGRSLLLSKPANVSMLS